MRRQAIAMVVIGAALVSAQAAQAATCPTVKDSAGDTGAFGHNVQDDATDITAVKVSTTKTAVTAAITVVGEPSASAQGLARRYEVYLETAEQGDFVLRGTLGNGQSRFQLVTHRATTTPQGSSIDEWQRGKSIVGRVQGNTVSITAPLDRDLPLSGQAVQVSATTWVADGVTVADGAAEGASMGVDGTTSRTFRIGDRGCA